MADDKHKIRNAVIASLTTTAIISLVVYLIPGGWTWVVQEGNRVVGAVVTWLGSSMAVPTWLVVIFSLLTIVVAIAVAIVTIAVMRKSGDSIESFTEADFFGIKWRWRYSNNGVYSITSYCPTCDLQVYPRHAPSCSMIERMVYRCENGHWESQEIDGTQAQIENRIEREIHREIRRKENAKRNTA